MTERPDRTLLRLMTWLSPAFPVGAFAYSHGLERAIVDGLVHDRDTLVDWIAALVGHGSAWNDAVLLSEAWRDAVAERNCAPIADLAEALAGSRERRMETMLQGEAFAAAAAAWAPGRPGEPETAAYPVAVAKAAAIHGIDLRSVLVAHLHAFASNLVQAAVRLVPLGQRDGVAALAALEPDLLETATRASRSTLDDLGAATFMSEVMAMRHEVQYSRVFRS